MPHYTAKRTDLYHPDNEPRCLLTYLPSDALLAAELARLAYTDSNPITQQGLQALGFSHLVWLQHASNKALLAWNPTVGKGVIAFRGTEPHDFGDIQSDLDTRLIDHPAGLGKVHNGFYQAVTTLATPITHWVSDKVGQWLITGHSLGAAMATIATTLLPLTQQTLFTFGSPRVGNATFITAVQQRCTNISRYVHCCDIVCRVPPCIDAMGDYAFQHTTPQYYIDHLGQIHAAPPYSAAQIHADHTTARWRYTLNEAWQRGNVLSRDLADHAPLNYVYALAKAESVAL